MLITRRNYTDRLRPIVSTYVSTVLLGSKDNGIIGLRTCDVNNWALGIPISIGLSLILVGKQAANLHSHLICVMSPGHG
jgi:hypothetical protein